MHDGLFDQMEELQRRHFWFRARARILFKLLARDWQAGLRVLDAGCGTGLLLSGLPQDACLHGLDPSQHALNLAATTLKDREADLRIGSLPSDIPFPPGSLDLVLLTDVLEHVDQDSETLCKLHALLAPKGRLLLTVPAFSFLWSRHDEEHQHFRRYTRGQLKSRLLEAGFNIRHLSYYNTLLFPLVLATRLLKRLGGDKGGDMDLPPRVINEALYHIFSLERFWTGRLIVPCGVSLIALAEKD